MDPDVFISYTQADRESAERLCSSLESAGVSCWIAPRNVAPGSEWAAAIMHAIHSAKALVLILSSNSKSSRQLAREVESADQTGLKIITFRIEDVKPPDELGYYLGNIQWIDGYGSNFDAAVQKLAQVVQNAPAVSPAAPAPAPHVARAAATKPIWQKPAVLALAALAVLLIAGTGFYFARRSSPPAPQPVVDNTAKPNPKAVKLLQKARTEWQDGNHDGAMADVSAAISDSPGYAAPYLYKARWEVATGDQKDALSDYDACIARRPDTINLIDAYKDRAKLKQSMGDAQGAKADQEAARNLLNPNR